MDQPDDLTRQRVYPSGVVSETIGEVLIPEVRSGKQIAY